MNEGRKEGGGLHLSLSSVLFRKQSLGEIDGSSAAAAAVYPSVHPSMYERERASDAATIADQRSLLPPSLSSSSAAHAVVGNSLCAIIYGEAEE